MDIEVWLQGLGLERYAPAFRENEIDWEVLPKLTSDDLREIGVAAVGHRRRLLDAISALGDYHRSVADTVARFAGFVAKYMGDGVLVYFGYPEAHEDDAERAVRAGLAVIEAVGSLTTPERLTARLGIASGLVVVGDLVGEGEAQERGVVGETPNLAARLQALATPGALVIAESTRRQIGALFEIEDLGPQSLA